MSGKSRLVNVHILLQCADAKHENMCAELRNALIDKFNEVKEADIITQIMGDTDFCVTGIAKIDPKKRKMFENALRTLKANSKNNSKVKDVKTYLEID